MKQLLFQLELKCDHKNIQAMCPFVLRAVPEIILRGVGRRHFFVLWGEGVLLTMCPRGGGGNVLGVKAYLIHSGAG